MSGAEPERLIGLIGHPGCHPKIVVGWLLAVWRLIDISFLPEQQNDAVLNLPRIFIWPFGRV